MSTHHTLAPTLATVHWGYLDAKIPPRLTIQPGDTVNVHGKWTDDTCTSFNASVILDMSIQKRFGAFVGTVSSVTASGWTMDTVNRGVQTVTVSSLTKLVNRKNESISQFAIKVGDRVRVKGLWDKANSTITEVAHVKDYSLPPKTTTATPSATSQ